MICRLLGQLLMIVIRTEKSFPNRVFSEKKDRAGSVSFGSSPQADLEFRLTVRFAVFGRSDAPADLPDGRQDEDDGRKRC